MPLHVPRLTLHWPDAANDGHHFLGQSEEGHVSGGGPGEVKLVTHTHQVFIVDHVHHHLADLPTLTLQEEEEKKEVMDEEEEENEE